MISPNLTTQRVACLHPPQADLSMFLAKLCPFFSFSFLTVLSILPILIQKRKSEIVLHSMHSMHSMEYFDSIALLRANRFSIFCILWYSMTNFNPKGPFAKNETLKITRKPVSHGEF